MTQAIGVPDELVKAAAEALCTPACQADHGRELVEDDCVLEARAALAAAFAKLPECKEAEEWVASQVIWAEHDHSPRPCCLLAVFVALAKWGQP